METKFDKLKMLFVIVDRKKGSKVTDLLDDKGLHFHMICLGRGTANSEMLEFLGLGETEKDVVISVMKEEYVEEIFFALRNDLKLETPAQGVAFTIPLNSIGGMNTLKQFTENS